MKKLYKYIAIAFAGVSLCSCNDWLDGVDSTSSVDDSTTWREESTVTAQVDYFYRYLNSWGQFGEAEFDGSITESLTDAFKYNHSALGARGGTPYRYATDFDYISPTQNALSGWSTAYTQIRYINQFLQLMRTYSTFGEEKNNLWEAQARFFRAFVYFQLAKRYDGAIIETTLPDGPNHALSPIDEVYDFIEEDLQFAIDNLPLKWDAANLGRISSVAAQAFLSRVELYAGRWQKAYDAAEAVIQSGQFSLMPNYADACKGSNSEAIIQFFYGATSGPSNSWDTWYSAVPAGNRFETGSVGVPTQEMVECYEYADGTKVDWEPWHTTTTVPPPYDKLEPRFAASIVYRGSTWMGVTMDCCLDGPNGVFQAYGDAPYGWNTTSTGYFLKKLCDESHTDLAAVKGHQTWVALRYAEVLLNKAEAAFRLNLTAEAQAAMNQVRARVNLPGVYSIGEPWFEAYRNERKVELSYEGHLYWDMRRWRLCEEYDGIRLHGFEITQAGTYTYVEVDLADRRFNPKTYCFPLPYSEVQNNSLAVQFPAWR